MGEPAAPAAAAAEEKLVSDLTEETFTPHDVVLGKGNGINCLPGNQMFRSIINKYKPLYAKTPRNVKGSVAELVINEIASLEPPGRFLEPQADNKRFKEVPRKRAIEKACQALREKKSNMVSPAMIARQQSTPATVSTLTRKPSLSIGAAPPSAPPPPPFLSQESLTVSETNSDDAPEKDDSKDASSVPVPPPPPAVAAPPPAVVAPPPVVAHPPLQPLPPIQNPQKTEGSLMDVDESLDDSTAQEENEGDPQPVQSLMENDVLYGGRGRKHFHRVANQRFLDLIKYSRQEYQASRSKKRVALAIITQWRHQNPPGRFLQQNSKDNKWYEIAQSKILEKTCQALRDLKRERGPGGVRPTIADRMVDPRMGPAPPSSLPNQQHPQSQPPMMGQPNHPGQPQMMHPGGPPQPGMHPQHAYPPHGHPHAMPHGHWGMSGHPMGYPAPGMMYGNYMPRPGPPPPSAPAPAPVNGGENGSTGGPPSMMYPMPPPPQAPTGSAAAPSASAGGSDGSAGGEGAPMYPGYAPQPAPAPLGESNPNANDATPENSANTYNNGCAPPPAPVPGGAPPPAGSDPSTYHPNGGYAHPPPPAAPGADPAASASHGQQPPPPPVVPPPPGVPAGQSSSAVAAIQRQASIVAQEMQKMDEMVRRASSSGIYVPPTGYGPPPALLPSPPSAAIPPPAAPTPASPSDATPNPTDPSSKQTDAVEADKDGGSLSEPATTAGTAELEGAPEVAEVQPSEEVQKEITEEEPKQEEPIPIEAAPTEEPPSTRVEFEAAPAAMLADPMKIEATESPGNNEAETPATNENKVAETSEAKDPDDAKEVQAEEENSEPKENGAPPSETGATPSGKPKKEGPPNGELEAATLLASMFGPASSNNKNNNA